MKLFGMLCSTRISLRGCVQTSIANYFAALIVRFSVWADMYVCTNLFLHLRQVSYLVVVALLIHKPEGP